MAEDMTKKKVKERASVMFGRPSARGLQKQLDAMSKPKNTSCFDGCFAALLGFPTEKSGSVQSYHAPQELEPLKPVRTWLELPASVRGFVRCEVGSMPKDEVPGWINQDSALACCTVGPECESKGDPAMLPLVFGVFDGHGRNGHEVSQSVADRLAGHLAEHEDQISVNPEQKLEAAAKAADHDVFKRFADRIEYSGSTGVMVLFDRAKRVLHVANVGDSRAVMGQLNPDAKSPRWDALALTKDCKPDNPEERERIEVSGGTVSKLLEPDGTPVGPMRVWEDATLQKPGLATSRTFGDGCGRSVGVISTPVVTSHKLLPEDRFLLVASDGLWDSLGNDEAVRIVGKFIHIPQVAVKALLEAVRREEGGSLVDDTTVVLVLFQ